MSMFEIIVTLIVGLAIFVWWCIRFIRREGIFKKECKSIVLYTPPITKASLIGKFLRNRGTGLVKWTQPAIRVYVGRKIFAPRTETSLVKLFPPMATFLTKWFPPAVHNEVEDQGDKVGPTPVAPKPTPAVAPTTPEKATTTATAAGPNKNWFSTETIAISIGIALALAGLLYWAVIALLPAAHAEVATAATPAQWVTMIVAICGALLAVSIVVWNLIRKFVRNQMHRDAESEAAPLAGTHRSGLRRRVDEVLAFIRTKVGKDKDGKPQMLFYVVLVFIGWDIVLFLSLMFLGHGWRTWIESWQNFFLFFIWFVIISGYTAFVLAQGKKGLNYLAYLGFGVTCLAIINAYAVSGSVVGSRASAATATQLVVQPSQYPSEGTFVVQVPPDKWTEVAVPVDHKLDWSSPGRSLDIIDQRGFIHHDRPGEPHIYIVAGNVRFKSAEKSSVEMTCTISKLSK